MALFSEWDSLGINNKGALTFVNRTAWQPMYNHYYVNKNGEYELTEPCTNEKIVTEEESLYSYWSPEKDNPYGCYDRMIVEKDAVESLVKEFLGHSKKNRVAYSGFSRGAYPSMSSLRFYDITGIDKLNKVICKTEGHDYTNYMHAMYMAHKMIKDYSDSSRDCYVLFISDGVPTTAGSYRDLESYPWNILGADDYPWYDDVYPVTNEKYPGGNRFVDAAKAMSVYFNQFLGEKRFYTVGFNTNDAANSMLKSMASDESNFIYCATAEEFKQKISLRYAYNDKWPAGVLNDRISGKFDLIVDEKHPITVAEDVYYTVETAEASADLEFHRSNNGTVEEIQWDAGYGSQEGKQLSFYVKLKPEFMAHNVADPIRVYETNADTKDAPGAELVYNKIIYDEDTESYQTEDKATTIGLKTPYVKISNYEMPADEFYEEYVNGGGDDSSEFDEDEFTEDENSESDEESQTGDNRNLTVPFVLLAVAAAALLGLLFGRKREN